MPTCVRRHSHKAKFDVYYQEYLSSSFMNLLVKKCKNPLQAATVHVSIAFCLKATPIDMSYLSFLSFGTL